MEVRTLKFISIPIIFFVNFAVGIITYIFISKRIKSQNSRKKSNSSENVDTFFVSSAMRRFLTLANFFCGGVFLATSLIGLYPGVNSKFNEILRKRTSIPEYPYAGLSLAVGFFLVWILEIMVHACLHYHSHSHDSHKHNSKPNSQNHGSNKNSIKVTSFSNPEPDPPQNPPPLFQEATRPSDRLLNGDDNVEDDNMHHSDSVQVTIENNTHEAHSHVPIKGNLLGSVMLTFALGSHSIIEGLGFAMIGEFSMTINMLITVLIHESVCALSLGVNLASKKTRLVTSLALLATFSALIPAGMGIGLAVDMGMDKNLFGDAVTACLQGIAAGTFIYVVFMEILPVEILQHADAVLKIVMMIFGFTVIASMKIFHPHGEKPNLSLNCTTNASSFPPT